MFYKTQGVLYMLSTLPSTNNHNLLANVSNSIMIGAIGFLSIILEIA